MPDRLHIFAVSDSVGETAEKIAVASVLQFKIERSITRFSRVTKEEQVLHILDKAIEEDAIIIYTIVKPELSEYLDKEARSRGIVAVNVMEPIFNAIMDKTGLQPAYISGLTHKMDDNYFNRVKAIEFTIDHDNGQNLDTINQADLIILGLPRTSKTPLSMHLANVGIKVANFPIDLHTEIPEQIMELKEKVPMVGLTIDIDTLLELRKERARSFDLPQDIDSLDDLVAEELDNAYRIYAKLKCLVIDVTLDDIEEIANTITHKFNLPLKVFHHRFK
ncbi:Putative pyruvate, phosphate dikinase regulatory protein [Syntrophomonas zehnderi OL-4]|uniref:Putative pyruvate, phosphate dikinase regulatory protein n=1 Tax=Syntrophomonas zehnderi OL-4 TaxID=690567 RepID=A0A0E4GC75_9FIRM|nr:pyruvate, water dikinase regulatory protein [Syntrophomonas zehnderi]CFY11328.1 Putative pyruvate, phosphate dikinase regulatory protein [Syntrophomonas zehnderi OL-4]